MTETGQIVAINADRLRVATVPKSACSGCAVRKGCGLGLLNTMGGKRSHVIDVLPGKYALSSFAIGNEVIISIPEKILLKGALFVYLVPLVAMLIGAILGAQLGADTTSLFFAIVGFVLGVSWVRLHTWLTRYRTDWWPTVVKNQEHFTAEDAERRREKYKTFTGR